jgi:hypothetical protein
MSTYAQPMCALCERFLGYDETTGRGNCDIYSPIPVEIFFEAYDHRNSFPGDGGDGFVPIDDDAGESVKKMFKATLK